MCRPGGATLVLVLVAEPEAERWHRSLGFASLSVSGAVAPFPVRRLWDAVWLASLLLFCVLAGESRRPSRSCLVSAGADRASAPLSVAAPLTCVCDSGSVHLCPCVGRRKPKAEAVLVLCLLWLALCLQRFADESVIRLLTVRCRSVIVTGLAPDTGMRVRQGGQP